VSHGGRKPAKIFFLYKNRETFFCREGKRKQSWEKGLLRFTVGRPLACTTATQKVGVVDDQRDKAGGGGIEKKICSWKGEETVLFAWAKPEQRSQREHLKLTLDALAFQGEENGDRAV